MGSYRCSAAPRLLHAFLLPIAEKCAPLPGLCSEDVCDPWGSCASPKFGPADSAAGADAAGAAAGALIWLPLLVLLVMLLLPGCSSLDLESMSACRVLGLRERRVGPSLCVWILGEGGRTRRWHECEEC